MLDNINSDKAKLILVYLSETKEATVTELKEVLSIRLLEVYSILRKLVEKGLVEKLEKDTYRLSADPVF